MSYSSSGSSQSEESSSPPQSRHHHHHSVRQQKPTKRQSSPQRQPQMQSQNRSPSPDQPLQQPEYKQYLTYVDGRGRNVVVVPTGVVTVSASQIFGRYHTSNSGQGPN